MPLVLSIRSTTRDKSHLWNFSLPNLATGEKFQHLKLHSIERFSQTASFLSRSSCHRARVAKKSHAFATGIRFTARIQRTIYFLYHRNSIADTDQIRLDCSLKIHGRFVERKVARVTISNRAYYGACKHGHACGTRLGGESVDFCLISQRRRATTAGIIHALNGTPTCTRRRRITIARVLQNEQQGTRRGRVRCRRYLRH